MKRQILTALLISLLTTGGEMTRAASDPGPLRLVQTIPLAGVEGRIDHLAVDLAGQRLFVAALGNNTMEVIDLKRGQRIRSVAGFKEPQGIAYLPDTNTVAVANGGDGVVTLLDGATLKPVKTIAFGDDADNLRYDATRKRLYVGYGNGALGVYDAAKGARLPDVALDAHPESFQLDAASGRIFVNVASLQKVAVVDANRSAVTATWPVRAGAASFPMAFDAAHHRLFVLTRKPPHLVVLDAETGKEVATLPADGDADDLFYDAAQKRLYGCFGAGSVIVYDQGDADHYTALAKIPTAAGARTGLFAPDLQRLFVAVPHRSNPGAEIRVFDTGARLTAREEASPPLAVFVCEHGSAKSLVAASFFERMAKERGIAAREPSGVASLVAFRRKRSHVRRRRGPNPRRRIVLPMTDYLTTTLAESITNEVCSEAFSVDVKVMRMLCPA
jgi:DNA-binding beta-propeller fold protein YncE